MFEEALRICLLTYRGNPRSGGQGIYVSLLSKELAQMGHHVDVWSGPPYPELGAGVGLVKVPSLDLWNEKTLLRLPKISELRDPINIAEWGRTMLGEFSEPRTFTNRVARTFQDPKRSLDYDIVHDNQSLGPGLLELQQYLPVVATIHHPVTMDLRSELAAARNFYRRYGVRRWYSFLPMQQRVSRLLDRILTVSQASANDLERDYGIARDRLRVVGNGINLETFTPRPDIKRRENQLVTTLSADSPLKGFSFLLEAIAALRKERPSLSLTVIGQARAYSGTTKRIRRLGVEDAVNFTGRVPAEEIARRYAESTAAVVASLYEGFGFPAGEAMACEVPVVSTRAGALPEVVGESGSCGILVKPGCSADLTRGIRQVLDASPEVRTLMGKAGRARVEKHFTWRRAAERTVDNYREVIAERIAERGDGRVATSLPRSGRITAARINGTRVRPGRGLEPAGAALRVPSPR